MTLPLPPRPKLGRRERWLLVATVVVVGEGVLAKFGLAASETSLMFLVSTIAGFIGAETYRPSGTSGIGSSTPPTPTPE